MMRGFPHVLRNVRALDLNRGCVPLALRAPRVCGAAFYFLRLLNHTGVINGWNFLRRVCAFCLVEFGAWH